MKDHLRQMHQQHQKLAVILFTCGGRDLAASEAAGASLPNSSASQFGPANQSLPNPTLRNCTLGKEFMAVGD